MTAAELKGPLPSVLWGLTGIGTAVAGFTWRWKHARIIGLVVLALTVGRVFLIDMGDLDPLPRVVSFAILGGLLLLLGYWYNHNKEKLQKYLDEE